MTLYSSLPTEALSPSVVALGCFDGVHLGHRAVILNAVRWAKELGLPCTVFAFESSPKNYFFKDSVPQLTDRETKIALIEALGADRVVCLPFDETVSATSAEDFFHQILRGSLGAKHIVCGYNYSFGAKGAGNTALLASLCDAAGVGLSVLPPITIDGTAVSASAIRQALEEGRLDDAYLLLGRFFSIRSAVVDGQHLGRKLGFPTVNQILSYGRVIPKHGVYFSRVSIENTEEHYFGITNIGTRPTVGSDFVGAETHILDFEGDLYGKQIEVELLSFLRSERKFNSIEELSAQVHADIETAKKMARDF